MRSSVQLLDRANAAEASITITLEDGEQILSNPIVCIITDWLPQGEGTYKPIGRIQRRWQRIKTTMRYVAGFPITGRTLKALVTDGHVVGVRDGRGWLCDVESLLQFVHARQLDPGYWERIAAQGHNAASATQTECSPVAVWPQSSKPI